MVLLTLPYMVLPQRVTLKHESQTRLRHALSIATRLLRYRLPGRLQLDRARANKIVATIVAGTRYDVGRSDEQVGP